METSLNGPGFSITLGNISGIARVMETKTTDIIALLDAPTTAPAWPKNGYAPIKDNSSSKSKAGANGSTSATPFKGPISTLDPYLLLSPIFHTY